MLPLLPPFVVLRSCGCCSALATAAQCGAVAAAVAAVLCCDAVLLLPQYVPVLRRCRGASVVPSLWCFTGAAAGSLLPLPLPRPAAVSAVDKGVTSVGWHSRAMLTAVAGLTCRGRAPAARRCCSELTCRCSGAVVVAARVPCRRRRGGDRWVRIPTLKRLRNNTICVSPHSLGDVCECGLVLHHFHSMLPPPPPPVSHQHFRLDRIDLGPN